MRLLTPPGLAGIAVLRADGDECDRVRACLRATGSGTLRLAPGGAPVRAALVLRGQVLDDVLALARPDGAIEVHVHGAPAVIDQLDACFGLQPAAPADAAERLLWQAQSTAQLELAREQSAFDFAAEIERIRVLPAARRDAELTAARERSRIALALAEPRRLALIGRQNAGKSSLFNRLLFRERALTGGAPGLTRDPIAEVTVLGGYPYELLDTPGEGPAASGLDRAAIERGREIGRAALRMLVVDGSQRPTELDRELGGTAEFVVRSKLDLEPARWPDDFAAAIGVSATTEGASSVRERFGALLAAHRRLPVPGPVGGFAALDESQWQSLVAIDADCGEAPPSA